jgi:hypothetical protein
MQREAPDLTWVHMCACLGPISPASTLYGNADPRILWQVKRDLAPEVLHATVHCVPMEGVAEVHADTTNPAPTRVLSAGHASAQRGISLVHACGQIVNVVQCV